MLLCNNPTSPLHFSWGTAHGREVHSLITLLNLFYLQLTCSWLLTSATIQQYKDYSLLQQHLISPYDRTLYSANLARSLTEYFFGYMGLLHARESFGFLAFWLFFNRKNNFKSSITDYKPKAYGPSSPKPYIEERINPDSLQACLLFPPSLPHPSHRGHCSRVPLHRQQLSSYFCPPTTARAKGSRCCARFRVCRPQIFVWPGSPRNQPSFLGSPRLKQRKSLDLSSPPSP